MIGVPTQSCMFAGPVSMTGFTHNEKKILVPAAVAIRKCQ